MTQCVPSWEVDDNPTSHRLNLRAHSNSNSLAPDVPMLDYEVAELTWENGQLAMHGLGHPRMPNKPPATSTATKYTWEKPRAGGTLESIVNQATRLPHRKPTMEGGGDELVPWFDHRRAVPAAAAMTMDALVPCSNRAEEQPSKHVLDSVPGIDTCVVGCSTRVGSCSGGATFDNSGADEAVLKCVNGVTRFPVAAAHEWSSRDHSTSGSATFGMDSRQLTLESCERELGAGGFTSTSMGSPGNTSSGKQCTKATTGDEHDSVCHSRPKKGSGGGEDKKKATRKSSLSTKRSRAAAIHNQSERKRRDKINQRMKTLQKLVPNSSKTDKASMLDEVIEYLKQLQAQVQMMGRMNMSQMMLPMTLQQQLQVSMMAQLGMGMGVGVGMGMGTVMDMNTIGTGIPPVLHPAAFMPLTSWDAGIAERTLPAPATVMPDPFSAFIACQSQPMTMDAYSRMAALYHQLHQTPPPGSKN